jgi:hypothetical protein
LHGSAVAETFFLSVLNIRAENAAKLSQLRSSEAFLARFLRLGV